MTGHAERAHARLSASGSKRWLTCTPSANLEDGFEDSSSSFAEEGTAAHELSELVLQKEIDEITALTFKRRLNKFKKENEYYSDSMLEYVTGYTDFVMERYAVAKARSSDALILLEQRLDFSEWVPDGFGTGDVLIISDGIMEVIDLKYGKGVPVSAEGNPQMRLYALGAMNQYDMLYGIDTVQMTIVQPRLDSISTDELSAEALYTWATDEVKPKAEMATNGEGEFVAGEHCRFCKAKAVCKARADENLKMAEYDFADPNVLSDDEIGAILTKADELQKWAKDVQDYALKQAEHHGATFPGFKLVEGRSNRKYTDEEAIVSALRERGFTDEAIFEKKLLAVTKMEKSISKKTFDELLNPFIVKPPGKPTLVPESDKRPALNSLASAEEDFN